MIFWIVIGLSFLFVLAAVLIGTLWSYFASAPTKKRLKKRIDPDRTSNFE